MALDDNISITAIVSCFSAAGQAKQIDPGSKNVYQAFRIAGNILFEASRWGVLPCLEHNSTTEAQADVTNITPVADDVIEEKDIIVAIGRDKSLQKLEWL